MGNDEISRAIEAAADAIRQEAVPRSARAIVREVLPTLEKLRAQGMSWQQISRACEVSGMRRPNGSTFTTKELTDITASLRRSEEVRAIKKARLGSGARSSAPAEGRQGTSEPRQVTIAHNGPARERPASVETGAGAKAPRSEDFEVGTEEWYRLKKAEEALARRKGRPPRPVLTADDFLAKRDAEMAANGGNVKTNGDGK